ncbi:MAG: TrkA C-terminal domain-containing protein [bacterium]
MSFFEEIDLPGIGKKYIINIPEYEINVIVYESGIKHLYFLKEDEIVFEVTLTREDSKNLGMILTETFYKTVTKDKVEYFQKQIIFEWLKIPSGSKFIDKTISELDIRAKTGVSVIGVVRKEEFILNPDPINFKLNKEDILVCVGNRQQLNELERYIRQ